MDDRLGQACSTTAFGARLQELEKESRKLRYRRLSYVEAMEEIAGPLAWDVITAMGMVVSDDADLKQLWLAIRNELIRQTRDAQ